MTITELWAVLGREIEVGNGKVEIIVTGPDGTDGTITRTFIDDVGGPGENAIYFFIESKEKTE